MLDRCKSVLFKTYSSEEKKGVFLSGFDAQKKLLVSKGMIETNRSLGVVVEDIYTQAIQPLLEQIRYLAIDVVTEVTSFADAEKVFGLDPKVYGIAVEDLEDQQVAIMLPNTSGTTDMHQVLFNLKKKYPIHGKAAISGFTTQRIIIAK